MVGWCRVGESGERSERVRRMDACAESGGRDWIQVDGAGKGTTEDKGKNERVQKEDEVLVQRCRP